jgi:hypothetical protein
MYYVLQMWTDFIAGWKRRPDNSQIHSDISSSIYNVCFTPFLWAMLDILLLIQILTILPSIFEASCEGRLDFRKTGDHDTF